MCSQFSVSIGWLVGWFLPTSSDRLILTDRRYITKRICGSHRHLKHLSYPLLVRIDALLRILTCCQTCWPTYTGFIHPARLLTYIRIYIQPCLLFLPLSAMRRGPTSPSSPSSSSSSGGQPSADVFSGLGSLSTTRQSNQGGKKKKGKLTKADISTPSNFV